MQTASSKRDRWQNLNTKFWKHFGTILVFKASWDTKKTSNSALSRGWDLHPPAPVLFYLQPFLSKANTPLAPWLEAWSVFLMRGLPGSGDRPLQTHPPLLKMENVCESIIQGSADKKWKLMQQELQFSAQERILEMKQRGGFSPGPVLCASQPHSRSRIPMRSPPGMAWLPGCFPDLGYTTASLCPKFHSSQILAPGFTASFIFQTNTVELSTLNS